MAAPLQTVKVKSVVSGDTIAFDNGKQLSLAYISAPRLQSEPYGYQSREFLRQLLVGKTIKYRVFYSINNRDYGDALAPIFTSLIEHTLAHGTTKLRDGAQSRVEFPELYEKFHAAQEKAESEQVGLWAPEVESSYINTLNSVTDDVLKSNKVYDAIVERVISGDRVQVRVILNPETHILANALVAGIRSPRSSSSPEANDGEPFGDEAKAFTESRLLQRSVKARFFGTATNGLPIVELIHPNGNIAVFLLQGGLATISDWHSSLLGPSKMSELRAAEKKGKDSRLKLWKGLAPAASTSAATKASQKFTATVTRVVSSDTFVVTKADGTEETLQLSSLRAPRKTDPPAIAPYVPIAKEFTRNLLIGKSVQVTVDAIRPESAQFDSRPLVTASIVGQNVDVSSAIVEAGYATVTRHRKDDTDTRSPQWDELLEKEKKSIEANKGIHGKSTPPVDRTLDASENASRAKTYLNTLSRQKPIYGVVDHVISAGRIRISVPKSNIILTLVHAGLRSPRLTDPFGQDALKLVTSNFNQRDVSFTVSSVDKTGAFIGNLFFPGEPNKALSVELVAKGYAELHEPSVNQSGLSQELLHAEKEAQESGIGIWKDYKTQQELAKKEEEEIKKQAQAVKASSSGKTVAPMSYIDIKVTNVSRSGEVSYRLNSKEEQFKKLSSDLLSFNTAAANASKTKLDRSPRKGDLVAIASGGNFFRGRVVIFDKLANNYTVHQIDTGVVSKYGLSSLRSLPSQFSTVAIPELAKTVSLSFIKLPPSSPTNYLAEYVDALKSQVEGQRVVANVDSPSTVTPPSVTIFTAKSKGAHDSVNSYLIDEGYAFLKTKLKGWEASEVWKPTLSTLKDLQRRAQEDRIGVWEYGDPESDEE